MSGTAVTLTACGKPASPSALRAPRPDTHDRGGRKPANPLSGPPERSWWRSALPGPPTPWQRPPPIPRSGCDRRCRLPRLAPVRRGCSPRASRSSAWTTSSPAPDNIEHLFGRTASRFVHHDVTNFIHVAGPARLRPPLRLAGVPHRLPQAADPDPQGRLARHPQGARAGQVEGRALPARLDLRGVRRPAGPPAARELLGQRQPGRPARGLRRGQALRRGHHHGLPPHHGVDTRIVRIFNTYGPRMRAGDGRVVPTFICQALAGEPLTVFGDGSQTRSFCYVDDLIEGIWRLLNSDHAEPVNIGNPSEMTVLEFAREIIRLTGSSLEIVFTPLPVRTTPRCASPTSAGARVLGWEPRSPSRTDSRRPSSSSPTGGSRRPARRCLNASSSTSSARATAWMPRLSRRRDLAGQLVEVALVGRRQEHAGMPARIAASTFSLTPPTGSTSPRRVISPVMARSWRTGRPEADRDHGGEQGDRRRRVRPWGSRRGDVEVQRVAVEPAAGDAEAVAVGAREGDRRRWPTPSSPRPGTR
jgi:dTDP-glucose 4,6-dehydratase